MRNVISNLSVFAFVASQEQIATEELDNPLKVNKAELLRFTYERTGKTQMSDGSMVCL